MKYKYTAGHAWWIGMSVVVIGASIGGLWASDEKAPPTSPAGSTAPDAASKPISPSATATAPGKPSDLRTPSAVTKQFIRLLGRSDGEQLKKLVHSVGAEETRFNEATIKLFAACGRLHDASLAKFGPEGDVSPVNGNDDASVAQLDLDEQITGEQATVRLPAGHNPTVYYFDRVGGAWKLRLYKTFKDTIDSSHLPGTVVEKVEAANKGLDELAQNIKSGKFSTADEAREKLKTALGID